MQPTLRSLCIAVVTLGFLLAASSEPLRAAAESDGDDQAKIVRKVVIDCDEDSTEDCKKKIHIESVSGDSHVMQVGDHQMIWIGDEDHATHYTMGHEFGGKGGFLGVQLTELTPELRSHFGVSTDEGVMVAKIVDDSAAFRAGIQVGDIITRVDGSAVGTTTELTHAVRAHEEGETIALEIWRAGSFETVAATLDQQEALGRFAHRITIDCEDDQADCDLHVIGQSHQGLDIGCPDGDECEVKIDCSDGDCECTVNGDSVDCQELHAEHASGH